MRIFKTKSFVRYAKKSGINDKALCDAIKRIERGIVDADLGGGIIKQRIPRDGQGRSSGFRTLIAVKTRDRAFFLYGFAKNEQDNIDDAELESLKEMALAWFSMSNDKIKRSLEEGLLQEVNYE